ncbi:MAG: hypothetical protein EXQ91_03250 [Alphaproteobacteria bacterium]|nr:hypothetical protein [Alphaproteobacteria bacterium]
MHPGQASGTHRFGETRQFTFGRALLVLLVALSLAAMPLRGNLAALAGHATPADSLASADAAELQSANGSGDIERQDQHHRHDQPDQGPHDHASCPLHASCGATGLDLVSVVEPPATARAGRPPAAVDDRGGPPVFILPPAKPPRA